MIHTPWFDEAIPFQEAAEMGTRKVIQEHSTIGVVVTCDGSIADIPRESYVSAEARVIEELKEVGKPFVVVINSTTPTNPVTLDLRSKLADEHNVPVIIMSVADMDEPEAVNVMKEVLYEFPVHEVNVNLPSWVMVLDDQHWLRRNYEDSVRD
jgi:stage IV sporulation protein A